MSDTPRDQLANQLVVSMPRFGYWATSINDFETPYGRVGYRQLELIWAIRHQLVGDGPVTPSAIATYFEIQPSVVTRILARLEAHDFIVRIADPNDGRRVSIEITDKGLHVSKYVEDLYHQEALSALASLDDEAIEALRQQVEVLDQISIVLLENRKRRTIETDSEHPEH